MVCEHLERSTMQIRPPLHATKVNGKQLPITHGVVALSTRQFLGKICNRVRDSIGPALLQHCPDSYIGCIGLKLKRLREIRQLKNRSTYQTVLQPLKTMLHSLGPLPIPFPTQLITQGGCNGGKTTNEAVIIVREPEKLLYVAYTCQPRPLLHGNYFVAIHFQRPTTDNMPQIPNSPLSKLTFGALSKETMRSQPLKHLPKVNQMLLQRLAINQQII